MEKYWTIKQEITGEYKEKGSRFIACISPAESEYQAYDYIERIRKANHKARHVCYAFKIGFQNPVVRINDDGEPVHTAGQPILNKLNHANLTQIVAVVVRYFGGILLGKGGLIRAYAQAIENALTSAEIVEAVPYVHYKLKLNFEKYSLVQEKIIQSGAVIKNQSFSSFCELEIKVPEKSAEHFSSLFTDDELQVTLTEK